MEGSGVEMDEGSNGEKWRDEGSGGEWRDEGSGGERWRDLVMRG